MITIKALRDVKYDDYDEVWAIVRKMKYQNPRIKQVTALAPSIDLYIKYRMRLAAGMWNEEEFQKMYVPQFLRELKGSREGMSALAELYNTDKDICLTCFCPNECMCHRSIVAGILQGMGADVDAGADYSRYLDMM